MEIRYRVFDNRTLKDITDEFQWVITPDGKLCYEEYDDLLEAQFAHFELMIKRNGKWEIVK